MSRRKYEVGDEVRCKGWPKREYVTLTQRLETPSGDKGWRGRHSTKGHFVHLLDGSFTPRRGKRKAKETTE